MLCFWRYCECVGDSALPLINLNKLKLHVFTCRPELCSMRDAVPCIGYSTAQVSVHSGSTTSTHVCGCCIAFLSWIMCTKRLTTAARARSRGPRNTQPTREIAEDKVELAFLYLVYSSSTLPTHVCCCCIAFLSWSMCSTRLPTAARARSRGPRTTQLTREIAADKVELVFPHLVYSSSTITTHVYGCCIAFLSWSMCTLQGCPLQLEHVAVPQKHTTES
jgi:hypothetical protein